MQYELAKKLISTEDSLWDEISESVDASCKSILENTEPEIWFDTKTDTPDDIPVDDTRDCSACPQTVHSPND